MTPAPTAPGQEANAGRHPARARRRRLYALAVSLLAVVLLASSCETTSQDRDTLFSLINQSRAGAGRAALAQDSGLNAEADRWAQEMRNSCTLKHRTDLTGGIPAGTVLVGETIAYNTTVTKAHQALMNSAPHRAIITDSRMTHVGIGAVYGDCFGWHQVWVVYIFARVT